jgi:hypothetical protein
MRLRQLHSQLMIDVRLQDKEIYSRARVMRFMYTMNEACIDVSIWRAILRFTNGTAGSRSALNQPVTGTSVLG